MKEKRRQQGTQWCSGITCVLAGLRAHYPEHQHEERKRGRKEERKKGRKEEKRNHAPFSHTTAIPQRHNPVTKTHPQTNNTVTANTTSGTKVKRKQENDKVLTLTHPTITVQHNTPQHTMR